MRFPFGRGAGLVLALAASAGCAAANDPAGFGANVPPPEPDPAVCGASDLQDIVGLKFDAGLLPGGPDPIRVIRPDMALTMDFRADRLNVLLDDEDTITEIRCG